MSVELPNGRGVFLPKIPTTIQDKVVREYLQSLVNILEDQLIKQFDNTNAIVSTGTSGTFVSSGGDTITINSGIVTGLT